MRPRFINNIPGFSPSTRAVSQVIWKLNDKEFVCLSWFFLDDEILRWLFTFSVWVCSYYNLSCFTIGIKDQPFLANFTLFFHLFLGEECPVWGAQQIFYFQEIRILSWGLDKVFVLSISHINLYLYTWYLSILVHHCTSSTCKD